MQVVRHKLKYKFPDPIAQKKCKSDSGHYQCHKCNKKFIHQNSAVRHFKMIA